MLEGLPTFFLVLLLSVLVKYLYFKPLDEVLEKRHRLTDGARQAAEASFKNADAKISEYENSLTRARAEIYAEQTLFLQSLHAEQAAQAQAIRLETEQRVAAAKQSVAQQMQESRASLEGQSDALASQIADAVLQRRPV